MIQMLIAAIETHQALPGREPRLVAADAAFYSAMSEAAAKGPANPHRAVLAGALFLHRTFEERLDIILSSRGRKHMAR